MENPALKQKASLRITYVLPVYWPAIGGCELHTHELVKRLSEKHDINVITLIDNQEDKLSHELWVACILKAPSNSVEYRDNHARVTRLSLKPLEKLLNLPLARMQSPKLPDIAVRLMMERLSNFYMKKLTDMLRGSDLVHCVHGGVAYFGYAAYKAASKLGIPFIYTPLLHLYHENRREDLKKSGNPVSYNPQLHLSPRGWTDDYWYQLCFDADALITMTDFEKDFFVRRGIPEKRVHKIGVGPLVFDNSTKDFRQEYNLEKEKIVLFLGRNVEYKGIEELLKAAAVVWGKIPDTHFFFAGPKEGDSENIFRRYSDSRVHVLGLVSESEKAALLKACDVFCMPSMEESLGGTFLEAWMFEKPVIGANIPPLMELTENGQGGFLVNPVAGEIAEKICNLLEDTDLARRMGKWGKKRVSENYTWEMITGKMEDIYMNLRNGSQPVGTYDRAMNKQVGAGKKI
ncbi:alpha-D-kanosaminyltransferase [bacterium BMS3Abin06]|nr:alpha-D-kanosaminyltransferase [bacterium BMS3Abin06]